MRPFVEHFTELDIGEWDKLMRTADRSGPGMIRTIAAFCAGESAVVRDEPNMWNLLNGISKFASGRQLDEGEQVAMVRAAESPEVMGEVSDLFKGFRRQHTA